ncbi:hypothetical protein WAI453_013006 [Rhynchosporium graminicola]
MQNFSKSEFLEAATSYWLAQRPTSALDLLCAAAKMIPISTQIQLSANKSIWSCVVSFSHFRFVIYCHAKVENIDYLTLSWDIDLQASYTYNLRLQYPIAKAKFRKRQGFMISLW